MDQKTINENYQKFSIPTEYVPVYTNAEDFAKNFKKCTILKDVNAMYSSTSSQPNCNNYYCPRHK